MATPYNPHPIATSMADTVEPASAAPNLKGLPWAAAHVSEVAFSRLYITGKILRAREVLPPGTYRNLATGEVVEVPYRTDYVVPAGLVYADEAALQEELRRG